MDDVTPRLLGIHPTEGLPVHLIVGRYGPCVQLGEDIPGGARPKRVSIPRSIDAGAMTLEVAVKLLELPRVLGAHPESGRPIMAGIGRFGPFVVYDGRHKSIPKHLDVLTIDLGVAIKLLFDRPSKKE